MSKGPRAPFPEGGVGVRASTTKGKSTLSIFSFWIKEGISVKRKFGYSFGLILKRVKHLSFEMGNRDFIFPLCKISL